MGETTESSNDGSSDIENINKADNIEKAHNGGQTSYAMHTSNKEELKATEEKDQIHSNTKGWVEENFQPQNTDDKGMKKVILKEKSPDPKVATTSEEVDPPNQTRGRVSGR